MREIEVEEAAGSLPELIEGLSAGEEITLTRAGKGIAKLTRVARRQKIALGLARGQFTVPDDFDAPLPDEVLALFYDSPLFPDEPTQPEPGGLAGKKPD